MHLYFSKSFDLIPQYLLIEKLAQNEEHFLGKWYWTEVIAQRSLQIITQPQALNVMPWEKLANATHRCIITEYEVKEGKWFWTNDCHYGTLSTSHFHASRKMWNTAENSKESYKNDARAGRQAPKIGLMQAGVFIDIYTEKRDLGQCFNVIYKSITRSNICNLKLNEFNLEIKPVSRSGGKWILK